LIREKIAGVMAELVVYLDYPDEDEDPMEDASAVSSIIRGLADAGADMRDLLDLADTGRIVREGLNVVITGKPNVGKSSLLNALLRDARAIVSDIPGTTRDSIDEYANIEGIPVRLTDTAGIRDAKDDIEAMGIERSKIAFDKADLMLFVLDASKPLDDEDREIMHRLGEKPVIVCLNKTDLSMSSEFCLKGEFSENTQMIRTSAKSGEGIRAIEKAISEAVYGGRAVQSDSLMISNERQKSAVSKALAEIEEAIETVRKGETVDFAETNMRAAYDKLGEITGQTANEEIIDMVFSRFCVGK
jgi:tRNA modification GTPase